MFCNTNLDKPQLDGSFPKPGLLPWHSQQQQVTVLFHQLFSPKRIYKSTLDTFSTLLANLGHNKHPLIIPMNRTWWNKQEHYNINPVIVDQVNVMRAADYIDWDKGCESWKRATRITATDKFYQYFGGRLYVDFKPQEWIIAQEWEDTGKKRRAYNIVTKEYQMEKVWKKKYLPFGPNRETRMTDRILEASYQLNHQHRIRLNGEPVVTSLRRIFSNQELTLGGRLYTCTSYGVQQHNKNSRSHILIDDNEVCELDYASLHINMLRSMAGLRPIEDAYTMILSEIPINTNDRTILRRYLKGLLQSILNCKSRNSAISSGNYEANYKPLLHKQEREVRNILKTISMTVTDLVSLFESCHSDILIHFYTGIGLRLQYLDSRIALRILDYFTNKRIVVLPVHDSFIIRRASQGDLKVIMNKAYQEVMKTKYTISIK